MNEMPYGGVMNWMVSKEVSVHDPRVHRGYRHMVAWGVSKGSYGPYIARQCEEAASAGAPADALYLSGSDHVPGPREWRGFADLREHRPDVAVRLTEYVEAMVRMEEGSR